VNEIEPPQTDPERLASQPHRPARPDGGGNVARRRRHRTAIWVSVVACAAILVGVGIPVLRAVRSSPQPSPGQRVHYLGVYERDLASASYAGVSAFTAATGTRPNILTYYSSWLQPFNAAFAATAAEHDAIPLIQINPEQGKSGISLAAIAAGRYDQYLTSYAKAIQAYPHQVILSFGHEMNGTWYPWAYTHTSPAAFVAAWRHIVTTFRQLKVTNVTWLWSVNIIQAGGIPSPAAWWPGSAYVTWVGVDGYYYQPSWTFTSLFGPTIAAVRELTRDPILIAETGAVSGSSQAAKVTNLFAGVRLYGLLGFVWFDAKADRDWRLGGAASSAFRQASRAYYRPLS
jgi:mannan endo-1,4-beta-mannosidase